MSVQIPEKHITIENAETGIIKYPIGSIWWLELHKEDEPRSSYAKLKRRPYLVLASTNSFIQVAPITSTETQNPFCIRIPKVSNILNDKKPYCYVALPNSEKIDINVFITNQPGYSATLGKGLLIEVLAALKLLEGWTLSDDDMITITSRAIEMRKNMTSIPYFDSPYFRYINDVDVRDTVTDMDVPITEAEEEVVEAPTEKLEMTATTATIKSNINENITKLASSLEKTDKITDMGLRKRANAFLNLVNNGQITVEDTFKLLTVKDTKDAKIEDMIEIWSHITGIKIDKNDMNEIANKVGFVSDNDIIHNCNLRRLKYDIHNNKEFLQRLMQKYNNQTIILLTGASLSTVNRIRTEMSKSKENEATAEFIKTNYELRNYLGNLPFSRLKEILKSMLRASESETTASEILSVLKKHGCMNSIAEITSAMNSLLSFKRTKSGYACELIPQYEVNLEAVAKAAKSKFAHELVLEMSRKGEEEFNKYINTLDANKKRVADAYIKYIEMETAKGRKFEKPTYEEAREVIEKYGTVYSSMYYKIPYMYFNKKYNSINS